MREISEIINFHDNFMKERDVWLQPNRREQRGVQSTETCVCLWWVGGVRLLVRSDCLCLSVSVCKDEYRNSPT